MTLSNLSPLVGHHFVPDEPIPAPPALHGAPTHASRFDLRVHYPARDTAVLTAGGEVDDASLPRLTEILQQRLASRVVLIVVDLTAVEFLSISGTQSLGNAARRARARGITLRVVTGTHAVRRAVRAAELETVLELVEGPETGVVPW